MREDLEQQEQLDAIKGFWRDNRRWILPLFIAIAGGWTAYQGYRLWDSSRAEEASIYLGRLELALEQQKLDEAMANGDRLLKDFPGTTQAALGALRIAKAQVMTGDLEKAAGFLEKASNHSDPSIAWIARLRHAAVLIDLDRLDAALKQLDGKPPASFEAAVFDRRGDVLLLLNRFDEARTAWESAKKAYAAAGPQGGGRSEELLGRKLSTLDAFKSSPPDAPAVSSQSKSGAKP